MVTPTNYYLQSSSLPEDPWSHAETAHLIARQIETIRLNDRGNGLCGVVGRNVHYCLSKLIDIERLCKESPDAKGLVTFGNGPSCKDHDDRDDLASSSFTVAFNDVPSVHHRQHQIEDYYRGSTLFDPTQGFLSVLSKGNGKALIAKLARDQVPDDGLIFNNQDLDQDKHRLAYANPPFVTRLAT